MAIDVSYRDTYTTSAEDLARTNRNFIINEGVAFDGLKVTQSLTPGMSVVVATGTGYFYGSGTNANVMYEFYSDATETVTIGTAGVQARIDIICLKVDASTGVASIVAVAGTPSGSPAVPATPASHYKLAEVAVGISVTTITNANITDRRRSVFVAPTGARNQGLINGKIVPSVASNNLTVAIKTLTDTDPTATNPVGIWIGNQLRWITSSLSVTANAGTNYLNMGSAELATREVDLFPYLQWNTTTSTVNLLYARIPYARTMSELVNSNTNEKGAVGIVNYNTGDNIVNVGRFAATLSAGAGHTWTVPTFTNVNLIQEPIYETRNLIWSPTYTASGSMTFTSVTNDLIHYKISYNHTYIALRAFGTTGGVANVAIILTLPIGAGVNFGPGTIACTRVLDGGSSGTSGFTTDIGPVNQVGVRKYDNSNWGLGTGRYIMISGSYSII
jgi:hypothetical protein